MLVFRKPLFFEWDKGNLHKNYRKHQVTNIECEEAFFDKNKKMYNDVFHSGIESRFLLLGKTKKDRLLFIVFTMRANTIRVISARDTNKKEYKLY